MLLEREFVQKVRMCGVYVRGFMCGVYVREWCYSYVETESLFLERKCAQTLCVCVCVCKCGAVYVRAVCTGVVLFRCLHRMGD